MIPMRDGVKLFTVILTPENQSEPLPILMSRTPYGVKSWNSRRLNASRPELVKEGFIFVYQDIRGRDGRYRRSFEKPEAIESNKVNEYTIDLRGNDYAFKKGHRMMVQIQSTWFPLYDRNPQKFVENIFLAKETDFQTATQRVYRSSKYPSHINLSLATQ